MPLTIEFSQDVLVRRANAEIVTRAKETREKPRQIVNEVLAKEPDYVTQALACDNNLVKK